MDVLLWTCCYTDILLWTCCYTDILLHGHTALADAETDLQSRVIYDGPDGIDGGRGSLRMPDRAGPVSTGEHPPHRNPRMQDPSRKTIANRKCFRCRCKREIRGFDMIYAMYGLLKKYGADADGIRRRHHTTASDDRIMNETWPDIAYRKRSRCMRIRGITGTGSNAHVFRCRNVRRRGP